jgi:hypothetical protein
MTGTGTGADNLPEKAVRDRDVRSCEMPVLLERHGDGDRCDSHFSALHDTSHSSCLSATLFVSLKNNFANNRASG